MADSQEQVQRATRLVGQVLRDKWRLDALIGVGGMAAVYAATHRNGKRVAIKLLHAAYDDESTMRARFLREGYVANKVGHPGVVSVLDDDTTEDGRAFLVMDLLEGETLKERWARARRRLPVEEVLQITHALLDVLAAAHAQGIVHRDLKPDNIFLTKDGAVKVLDFGIARLRENSDSGEATRSTAMLGTPAFMSPEQARSRWEWVDARTDLWAVGATMFTMLTGQFVHRAGTVTELIVAAATQQAPPLRSVTPVSERVAEIVDKALAYEQADRWPDARSMQAAIAAVLRGSAATTSAPPEPPTRVITIPLPAAAAPEPRPEPSAIMPAPTALLSSPVVSPLPPPASSPGAPYSSPAPSGPQSIPQSAPGQSNAMHLSGSARAQSTLALSSSSALSVLSATMAEPSTLMTMGTGGTLAQTAGQTQSKTRSGALWLAGGAALFLVGVVTIGIFVSRRMASEDEAPGDVIALPTSMASTASPASTAPPPPSVEPAPSPSVEPMPEMPASSASSAPSADAPATAKPVTTKPRVGPTNTTTTKKSKNPLDRF